VRVAIVGSREYPNLGEVRYYVGRLAARKDGGPLVIVSGGASGVDETAIETAEALGLETKVHWPAWRQYRRAAGPRRNEDLVRDADLVACFWDGASPGTRDVIRQALRQHKHLEVIFA
jgi:hypothetical protein